MNVSQSLPDNKEDIRLMAFLKVLRHEINTPLSVIRGYTDLIIEQYGNELDPEVYRFMQTIRRNIERLEASTEGALTLESLKESLEEEG